MTAVNQPQKQKSPLLRQAGPIAWDGRGRCGDGGALASPKPQGAEVETAEVRVEMRAARGDRMD